MNIDDLEQFCDEGFRPALSTPWSLGEYSYASNGHLIVRVPRLSDVEERDTAPKVQKMFDGPEPPEWITLADITLPKQKVAECHRCEGGKEPVHDCPDCNCKCDHCGDTGEVKPVTPVEIGVALFNLKYLLMLNKLPGCRIGLIEAETPTPFRFDGGDGLLMPMRKHTREAQ